MNPVRPWAYIPFADFHRVALAEKVYELFRLLTALRAETVEIDISRGAAKTLGVKAGLTVPADIPVKLSAKGGGGSTSTHDVRVVAKFGGTGRPHVPDDLQWYHHEPDWRTLAEGRMRGDVQDVSLAFRYVDDFGINASMKAGIEGVGFSVGANWRDLEAEEWFIRGTFRSKPLFGW